MPMIWIFYLTSLYMLHFDWSANLSGLTFHPFIYLYTLICLITLAHARKLYHPIYLFYLSCFFLALFFHQPFIHTLLVSIGILGSEGMYIKKKHPKPIYWFVWSAWIGIIMMTTYVNLIVEIGLWTSLVSIAYWQLA